MALPNDETFNQLKTDINALQSCIIGTTTCTVNPSSNGIVKQVQVLNDEYNAKITQLKAEIDRKEAIISKTNRDFSDVKDSLPERQSKKIINFIEDYTLAFLLMSYVLMLISGIYVYTVFTMGTWIQKLYAFGKAVLASGFLSCFLFILMFYLT